MIYSTILTVLFIISSLGNHKVYAMDCIYKAQNTSLYNAYNFCDSAQSEKVIKETSQLNKLNLNDYCYLTSGENNSQILNEQCSDPNGFACANRGKILDSKCNHVGLDSIDAESSPEFVKAVCQAEGLWNEYSIPLIDKTQCAKAFIVGADKCREYLTVKYPEKKAKIQRGQIYTPKRIESLKGVFKQVKTKYLDVINNSSKLSQTSKKFLIDKIEKTRLALEDDDINDPNNSDCHNISPGETSTAIYNTRVNRSSIERKIHVCAGAIANLDRTNQFLLIFRFAHELSHSIDPCAIETDMALLGNPYANAFKRVYPNTILCLRGGTGENGCENAVINCNTDQGRYEYCHHYYSGQTVHDCLNQYKQRPNCSAGKPDPNYNWHKLSEYEKTNPAREQIQEAFSDFIGAEITSYFLKTTSEKDKTDTLTSFASEISRLHGVCLEENTPDSHPPGFLRMNRIIMGNENFREAIGCLQGPPKTKKANITCPGI